MDEPRRVAESVASIGLHYATVAGVAGDDLPDGAAWLYAETCRQIHLTVTGCDVELLIPTSMRTKTSYRWCSPPVLKSSLTTVRETLPPGPNIKLAAPPEASKLSGEAS